MINLHTNCHRLNHLLHGCCPILPTRRAYISAHEQLYVGRLKLIRPASVSRPSHSDSSQTLVSLTQHHLIRIPPRNSPSPHPPVKVSSRRTTLPPIDKVDSARAAVASSGALQNIGSYFTGTLDSLSTTIQDSNQYISSILGVHPSFVYATTAAALVAVPVTMSRYGWSRSPYGFQPGGVPTVTEDDYTYITSQDLDEAGLGASDGTAHRQPSPSGSDDVLLIKSRGVNYPTHFPRHTIGDGKLIVRDVAQRAGLMMNLSERQSRSLKFLYKGRQLKEQGAPVRDYGVRNNSVLMAILPEGDDRDNSLEDETVVVKESKSQKKNQKRKEARKAKRRGGDGSVGSPPDSSSNGGAKSPSPVPGAAGQRRIDELANEFATKWLPACKEYIAKPPADARKRADEHTKLSETVLQHVLLKLDEVDTEGNPDVRQARKDLIRTVQDVLKQVDVARGSVDN